MKIRPSKNTPPAGQARPLSRFKILPNGVKTAHISGVQIESQGINYVDDLLAHIELPLVKMQEVGSQTEPCFYIRHDVDHSIERALAIAKVEADYGYSSTFFMLPPGSYPGESGRTNYYGSISRTGVVSHTNLFADQCKKIIDFGHDIGFHNDLVSLSLLFGICPREFLEKELEWFNLHGIKLTGTAAHGSYLARELKFNNKEIFNGCIRKDWDVGRIISYNNQQVKLHDLELDDFDLEYEAYSLPRDSRISDSGGKWGGRIDAKRLPREELLERFDLSVFKEHMSLASRDSDIKAFSIMTHPVYWEPIFR